MIPLAALFQNVADLIDSTFLWSTLKDRDKALKEYDKTWKEYDNTSKNFQPNLMTKKRFYKRYTNPFIALPALKNFFSQTY